MKYLFCILSLAFLLVGTGHVSTKDLQGFREDSGISPCCVSSSAVSSTDFTSSSLDDSPSDNTLSTKKTIFSKTSEHYTFGILTALSVPKTITPVRTLNFNAISTIVYLLSSQDSSLPKNRYKNLFSETNYLKYSSRYYIYTLAHILI